MKVAELPFRLATRSAFESAATSPAETVKGALMAPAATVTDDGIVTFAEFVPSPSETFVASAALMVSVTVHVVVVGVIIDASAHVSFEILGGG